MNLYKARRPRTATAIVAGLLAATFLPVPGPASASPPADVSATLTEAIPASRTPAPKPDRTVLTDGDSRTFAHVKFVQGTGVRLRDGRLVARSGVDLAAVQRVVSNGAVAAVDRLFQLPEETIDDYTASASARSGREQADLNLWYRVRIDPTADPVAVIDALNASPLVETAYPEPLPVRPPLAPDFRPQQGYRNPASSNGIDAEYARTIPGGTGANVQVIDIEYSWNAGHEDLSKLRAAGAMLANGTPSDPWNDPHHGTAVAGQLSGDNNNGGVLGLVPDARLRTTNAYNNERGYDLATSISLAAVNSRPGDVILLEQQVQGPTGCGQAEWGYVPVEWIPAYYDAIVAATSSGITVVEAAGNGTPGVENGGQNLDNACLFGTTFPSNRADSGAIIVGAGGAPDCASYAGETRARIGYSTYGRRVDLQGWGECVTTAGYGGLFGTAPNELYTGWFSGTSSASPIVASAAAALSSVAEQRGISLTPRDVRSRLRSTGTAQANLAGGQIGPLPNLRAAIGGLPAAAPWTASASVSAAGLPPANAIDGNLSTRWSTGVAQANGQYFQLDLGAARSLGRFVLDAGAANPTEYPRGWSVQVSNNGTTWGAPIATGTGSGRVTTIVVPQTTARYARITQTGSTTARWSIAELTVGT